MRVGGGVVVVAAPCSVAVHSGKIFFSWARGFRRSSGVLRADVVCGVDDPRTANVEEVGRRFEEGIGFYAGFIKTWKKIPISPAFKK